MRLVKDRFLMAMSHQDLLDELALKYGKAIRENEILITVVLTDADGEEHSGNVVAPVYTGDKLEKFEVVGDDAGKVAADLYIARLLKAGRKGKIGLGRFDNPSRISMEQLVASTRGMIKAEVAQGFMSGIFEGEILCERVKMNPNRSRFEGSDALVDFCLQIEAWWAKIGKKVIDEYRTRDGDERYQRLALSVLPFAELMLKQIRFQGVADQIKVGTTGRGHAEVPRKSVIGPGEGTALAIGGHPFEEKDKPTKTGKDGGKKPPTIEHPNHSPAIAYGPKGGLRIEVKGSSTGLRIAYEEMEDTKIPFTFDPMSGRLTFNIDHPDWSACEDSDTTLVKYHMQVIMAALSLELFRNMNGDLSQEVVAFAHRHLGEQVFAIMNGEAMVKEPVKRKK